MISSCDIPNLIHRCWQRLRLESQCCAVSTFPHTFQRSSCFLKPLFVAAAARAFMTLRGKAAVTFLLGHYIHGPNGRWPANPAGGGGASYHPAISTRSIIHCGMISGDSLVGRRPYQNCRWAIDSGRGTACRCKPAPEDTKHVRETLLQRCDIPVHRGEAMYSMPLLPLTGMRVQKSVSHHVDLVTTDSIRSAGWRTFDAQYVVLLALQPQPQPSSPSLFPSGFHQLDALFAYRLRISHCSCGKR
jgi:hypothetical protein